MIHLVRWAAGDPKLADADVLDAESMTAGIRLATWHKAEAVRVYGMLDESDDDSDDRRLLEWLSRRGGSVTPRDVQQRCSWLTEPGVAEAALSGWPKLAPSNESQHLRDRVGDRLSATACLQSTILPKGPTKTAIP